MKTERIIKKQARYYLSQGNWAVVLGCLAALFTAYFAVLSLFGTVMYGFNAINTYTGDIKKSKIVLGFITESLTLLLAFAISPAINGFFKLCYNIAKGKKGDARDLFFYFTSPRRYFRALGLNALRLSLFSAACLVLCIPGAVVIATGEYWGFENSAAVAAVLGGILVALGITISAAINLKLFLTNYIMAEYENAGAGFILSKTLKVSKGHIRDIAKLLFSFIFWILLCFFVLPVFYVLPYAGVSMGNSAKCLMALKEGAD